jgi:hypothetical protein
VKPRTARPRHLFTLNPDLLLTRLRLSLIALLVPGALIAQAPKSENPLKHDPRPTVPAITAADLMTRLYIFSDDSMMGREAGTTGNIKGTEYIARELKRLGLKPAGDNGTYFQDFPLESTKPDPATRVAVGDDVLTVGKDYLMFPAIGLPQIGAGFDAENVSVVYGGKIGDATLVSPDAVAGKLVLFAPADGPAGWQFWQRFGPAQYQKYGAAKGLILAALEVLPPFLTGMLSEEQVGKAGESGPAPTVALMYVTKAAAERLMGGPLTGLMAGTEGRQATVKGGFLKGPAPLPARNVVAIVPGTDPALRGQYVAFGAHNDHIGMQRPAVDHDSLRAFNGVVRPDGAEDMGKQPTPAQLDTVRLLLDSLRMVHPPRADSVMNGADDDGSGSMAVLELAEYFVKNPAKRSLLFVWHTGEEKGLWGSEYFTDHPTVPRDSIIAQLNMDMIGRGDVDDMKDGGPGALGLLGSRRLSTQLGDLVEDVNLKGKHGFTFDYRFDANGHPQQYYCRSDHYEYARYGIPIVFFSTGSHRDYHMATDEPQYIDYDKYARVTQLVMDVGRTVADLEQRVVVDKPKPDPNGRCVQ